MHYANAPRRWSDYLCESEATEKYRNQGGKAPLGKTIQQETRCEIQKTAPIGNFIVDFYCHEKKLVIEVDGSIHLLADNIEYDKIRSDVIVGFGVSIIRFTNEDIYFRMENVIALIKSVISESK